MTSTFMQSPQLFFTSESVTAGHPDKLCDQISDAILDAIVEQDPEARVACETAAGTGFVTVFGEVTTSAKVNYEVVTRDTVRRVGYDRPELEFDANQIGVEIRLHTQSPDIQRGVDHAMEADESEASIDRTGAGDQGMMIGFACTETPELMPLPISLAQGLTRRLTEAREQGIVPYLRPDGKAQVTVEYRYGQPVRVDTVLVSTQHEEGVSNEQIERDIKQYIVRAVIPEELLDDRTKYYVNPTGRFVIGGPHGDAGLTGRKIIVDTYGGMARHGGGAFSGKDATKVDRSAAYYARYVAKNIVAAGLAERIEIQVSYAIGRAHPLSIMAETFGTGRVPDEEILELINRYFDFRPAAIIQNLGLRKPIYQQTAANGHFGREDLNLPWERLDKADVLREAAQGTVAVRSA